MEKDYKVWHKQKRVVHNERPRVFFQEREIWFCHIGENIGFEQDGKGDEYLRPVVVFKKFNVVVLWVIPLTKTKKKIHKVARQYYFEFTFAKGIKSMAILSQLRLIDAKRLKYKIGVMSESNFADLKKKIRHLIA